jgi:YbbR domain-containing protein
VKPKLENLRDAVSENWSLKLLAALLAALTFFAIRGATSYEERYDVPVEIEVEPGIAILDQNPRTVEVSVRGSREDLARLDESRIKVVLRCKATDPTGSERLIVGRNHLEGLESVRVERIRPSVVMLSFDREAEKQVPVAKPKVTGEPLVGKVEIEYEPRFVSVRGPKRRLTIEEVYTEPVDVDGKVESFTKTVRVVPPGDTWVSRIEPSEITVNVRITKRTVSLTWPRIPILALVRTDGVKRVEIDPANVSLELEGRAELMDDITNKAVRVLVDCQDMDPDATYEAPVVVHLPPDLDVKYAVVPDTVKVTVRRR